MFGQIRFRLPRRQPKGRRTRCLARMERLTYMLDELKGIRNSASVNQARALIGRILVTETKELERLVDEGA